MADNEPVEYDEESFSADWELGERVADAMWDTIVDYKWAKEAACPVVQVGMQSMLDRPGALIAMNHWWIIQTGEMLKKMVERGTGEKFTDAFVEFGIDYEVDPKAKEDLPADEYEALLSSVEEHKKYEMEAAKMIIAQASGNHDDVHTYMNVSIVGAKADSVAFDDGDARTEAASKTLMSVVYLATRIRTGDILRGVSEAEAAEQYGFKDEDFEKFLVEGE